MRPHRVSSRVLLTLTVSALAFGGTACGSDEDAFALESETTRAIREQVRAEMEEDRLRQVGKRLAGLNERLANSPTASLPLAGMDEGAGEEELAGTPLERGEAIYTQNCSSCHGLRGDGDGPLGASLQPQPARHSDGSYMNALSDDHLMKVIKEGGPAVGKSSMMAPWGTSLSDERIRDVIVFLRTLADPPYQG